MIELGQRTLQHIALPRDAPALLHAFADPPTDRTQVLPQWAGLRLLDRALEARLGLLRLDDEASPRLTHLIRVDAIAGLAPRHGQRDPHRVGQCAGRARNREGQPTEDRGRHAGAGEQCGRRRQRGAQYRRSPHTFGQSFDHRQKLEMTAVKTLATDSGSLASYEFAFVASASRLRIAVSASLP